MDWSRMEEIVANCKVVAVIPHKNPDGDALGSSYALAHCLKKAGKSVSILFSGDMPKNLSFLMTDEFKSTQNTAYDTVIMVDCADEFRVDENEKKIFETCENTVVIDHHATNKGFGKLNYIDASSAAAGEIIYDCIENISCFSLDDTVAKYLYTAIVCDTGSFKYSNTTPKTHLIAAKLMEYNIDIAEISRKAFETKTINQCKLYSYALDNLGFFCGGKVGMTYVSYKYLQENNMDFDEADYLVSLPRDIEGVEVGVFLKIKSENEIKVSFRSNAYIDVAKLASDFGGGGHIRAAGCSVFNKTFEETKELIIKSLESAFNE